MNLKHITGHPRLVALFIIIIAALILFVELPVFLFLILFIALVPLVMLALNERFKKYSPDVPIIYPGSVVFIIGIIAALAALYLLVHVVLMLVGR
ncbi:MAG: hypothetical protein C4567_07480 [Deltaproteobacteria bacterium]|nr:MAG: hypothetical protein C4567_07480 [Deltaproteobacteria bacterium]